MMAHNISGVILAGGDSKRFNGLIKANIVIYGKSIISRIIETIGDIFDEIIIVTNTPHEFQEYNNYKIVGDKLLNKGPLGGIHAALKESEAEAVFVFAGDMPLLDKEIIASQIDFYNSNKCDVLIPQIDNYIEPLHGIYKKTLFRILEDYFEENNGSAIRDFIRKTDVRYFQIEGSEKSKSVFTNINSPSDISIVSKFLGLND
ncbi:MAG: molybdenum cofactor guanylyltransferase [Bacteroidales bacterium]|jgi:molybdopterin-guanine dinucleotide biosynthesis protein A